MKILKKTKKAPAYVSLLWVVFVILLLFLAYIITNNNINRRLIILSKQENSQRLRVAELEKEEKELRENISLTQTDAFIENEARTRYGYLKPGEIRFVISNPEALYGDEIPKIQIDEQGDQ